jgi:hypothetical protein
LRFIGPDESGDEEVRQGLEYGTDRQNRDSLP